MIDRQLGHGLGRRKADIDCHPAPSIRLELQAPPAQDTSACGSEAYLKAGIILVGAGIGGSISRQGDAPVLVIVGP